MQLTDLEMKVMKTVWHCGGSATVNEILENWEEKEVPGYTTVLKILQIMEDKGYVRHRRKGRAYCYQARLSRQDSFRHTLGKVLRDFFNGNKIQLANSLISEGEFSPQELQSLKKMIEEKQREVKNG